MIFSKEMNDVLEYVQKYGEGVLKPFNKEHFAKFLCEKYQVDFATVYQRMLLEGY